ncbi:hypothetical protein HRED_04278, partial [Candidatus Haloredivivus sp. G17]
KITKKRGRTKMKKILILADNFEDETEKFRKHFEEIEKKSLADTSIYSGKTPEIFIEDEKITSEHILYINPRPVEYLLDLFLLPLLLIPPSTRILRRYG